MMDNESLQAQLTVALAAAQVATDSFAEAKAELDLAKLKLSAVREAMAHDGLATAFQSIDQYRSHILKGMDASCNYCPACNNNLATCAQIRKEGGYAFNNLCLERQDYLKRIASTNDGVDKP